MFYTKTRVFPTNEVFRMSSHGFILLSVIYFWKNPHEKRPSNFFRWKLSREIWKHQLHYHSRVEIPASNARDELQLSIFEAFPRRNSVCWWNVPEASSTLDARREELLNSWNEFTPFDDRTLSHHSSPIRDLLVVLAVMLVSVLNDPRRNVSVWDAQQ